MLDPVTFEVLKNSFISTVDQMGEQILRTCYSFVIYNRDFSNALHDVNGNSASPRAITTSPCMSARCTSPARTSCALFAGDMHPGDVYAINDPYAGGTHFSDVRLIRPIFADGKIDRLQRSRTAIGPMSAAACRARSTWWRARCSARAAHHAGPAVGQGAPSAATWRI